MDDVTKLLANSDRFNAAEVTVETQLTIERFLHQQAEYLDEKQWEKWLSLFSNDGHYWMPAE